MNSSFAQGNFSCSNPFINVVVIPTNDPCSWQFLAEGEVFNVEWSSFGQTFTGNPILITFPNPGTFSVSMTSNNGAIVCSGTVDVEKGCNQGECDFNAVFDLECSRLRVNFTPDDATLALGHSFSYTINVNNGVTSILQGTGFANSVPHPITIPNINTCDQPTLSVNMIVRDINNDVICTVTKTFTIGIQGLFLGKECEVQKTSLLSPLLPSNGVFDGDPTDLCTDVYISGILDIDTDLEFNNTRVFMGYSSGLNVGSESATTLSLNDGTDVQIMDDCPCLWRGLNVYEEGTLLVNEGLVGIENVTLRDAMFGVRGVDYNFRTPNQNNIQKRPTFWLQDFDMTHNFICMRLTDGNFALNRLSNCSFTGGGETKFQCWSCPTIINDLQDLSEVKDMDWVSLVWIGNEFIGNFKPNYSINIDPVTGKGKYFIPNSDEMDYPFENITDVGPFVKPHRPYAGLLVDAIRPFGFGLSGASPLNITPANATQRNVFSDLEVGIAINGATANLRNRCSFDDITDEHWDENSGESIIFLSNTGNNNLACWGNTFSNSVRGIYAAPYFPGVGNISLRGNTMDNVQHGICVLNPVETQYTGNFNSVTIFNNNIHTRGELDTKSDGPPNSLLAKDNTYGIFVTDFTAIPTTFDINNNTITIEHPDIPSLLLTSEEGQGIIAYGLSGPAGCTLGTADCDVIRQNTINIKNGFEGITLNNCTNTLVDDNDVNYNEMNNPDIFDFTGMIQVRGGSGAVLNCNHVLGANDYSKKPNVNSYGIYTSFHTDGAFHTNSVEKVNYGMDFRGECGTASDIDFNNIIAPMRIGLLYEGIVDDPNNNPYATRTGDQLSQGNEWYDQNNSNTAGIFEGAKALAISGANIAGSMYGVVNCAGNPCPQDPSSEVAPVTGWFNTLGQLQTDVVCPGQKQEDKPQEITMYDRTEVINNEADIPALYFSKVYLYQRLQDNPSLLQANPELNDFMQQAESSPLGAIIRIQDLVQLVSLPDVGQANQLSVLYQELEVLYELVDNQHDNLMASPNDASLQDLYQSSLEQIADLEQAASTIYLAINTRLVNTAQDLYDEIILYSSSNTAEANLLKAMKAKLLLLAGYDGSVLEKTIFLDLAKACPEDVGPAKYVAAEVYTMLTGQNVPASDCTMEIEVFERRGQVDKNANTQSAFLVKPNPVVDGFFAIHFNSYNANASTQIGIYNSIGQLVEFLSMQDARLRIATEKWASGMYFIQLLEDGVLIETQKIIVK